MFSFSWYLTYEVPYNYPLGINTLELSAPSSASSLKKGMFAVMLVLMGMDVGQCIGSMPLLLYRIVFFTHVKDN